MYTIKKDHQRWRIPFRAEGKLRLRIPLSRAMQNLSYHTDGAQQFETWKLLLDRG